MANSYFISAYQRNKANDAPPLVQTYPSGTNQDPILLPSNRTASVTVSFDSAGAASVEGTTSPAEDVIAGLSTVVWVAWDNGSVSASSRLNCSGLTAVRLVRTSGTPRLTVGVFSGA